MSHTVAAFPSLDTTIRHNASNSATTPTGSSTDESITYSLQHVAHGFSRAKKPSSPPRALSVNTTTERKVSTAFNSTQTPTSAEDDDNVEMRDYPPVPGCTQPQSIAQHPQNMHIVGRFTSVGPQSQFQEPLQPTYTFQNLPPAISPYSTNIANMGASSVALNYYHNPHIESMPHAENAMLNMDARSFLQQDYEQNLRTTQMTQPSQTNHQSFLKKWLILESEVDARLAQFDSWSNLIEELQLDDPRYTLVHRELDVLQQLSSEWRQMVTMYFLAMHRIKVRFQHRCTPLGPFDYQSEAETKEFFLSYKRAQLTLLDKAEKHLRDVLKQTLQDALENIAPQPSMQEYVSVDNMDDAMKDDEEDEPSPTTASGPKLHKRGQELALPLVLHLQEFISEHITYPYMSEEQITTVSNQFLVDKQRIKRKLQNMRTRLWKSFVIEKGLVDGSYFKAGNQLKKHLSSATLAGKDWREKFEEWLKDKKRANWTYTSP